MTPEQINALPEQVRRYIHDLETRCDPAGDVAALALMRDQNLQLQAKVAELEALIADQTDPPDLLSWALKQQGRANAAEATVAELEAERDGWVRVAAGVRCARWDDAVSGEYPSRHVDCGSCAYCKARAALRGKDGE